MADDPKLQIDDDWKAEARREKEQLAEQVEHAEEDELGGPASFAGVVNILAMQAMVGLGALAGPGNQQIPPNPELAKHFIDLLQVLAEKTKGNLAPAEKTLLDSAIYNLRMAYVELMTALSGPPPAGPIPSGT